MPEVSEDRLKELEELAEKAKALEASKARVVEESDKFKKRAQEAEAKISEAEKKKLEEEGKLNDLLLKERKEKTELLDRLGNVQKAALREKVRSEVLKHAKDAHDVDMLLRVSEHKDLLEIDEDNLSVAGVENYVSKVRETHSFLFGKKKMPTGSEGKPKGNDDIDDRDDKQKFIDELRSVSSREEQMKVYKKYGKNVDSFMQR